MSEQLEEDTDPLSGAEAGGVMTNEKNIEAWVASQIGDGVRVRHPTPGEWFITQVGGIGLDQKVVDGLIERVSEIEAHPYWAWSLSHSGELALIATWRFEFER